MNIKEAKIEIKHALLAYHQKDSQGHYKYPLLRQRPILLIGPPGIGKTAIMEQISKECSVGLVAYTMTHHTRQSAIGLPKIVSRTYDGKEVSVTEYTLSEIITSVYDCMEKSGCREGILFIDEINCVSETLAPTMLQFLQNKAFGSHKIPEGWMIVAAGNPPEYNKSVREFDIVTLDRVRKIEIQPDLSAWMEYAWEKGIHGCILSYLNMKQEHFYLIENHADQKSFVTARGWEDLSEILKSYEDLSLETSEELVLQFLQHKETARDFFAYYQLYGKYGTDYGIPQILSGSASSDTYTKKVLLAQKGSFEERFTVIGLILDALNHDFAVFEEQELTLALLHQFLKHFKNYLSTQPDMQCFSAYIKDCRQRLETKESMELASLSELLREEKVIRQLEQYHLFLREKHLLNKDAGFQQIQEFFQQNLTIRKAEIAEHKASLNRAFAFVQDCFGTEQEMILFVSSLTRNQRITQFISEHGCDAYFRHSRQLLHLIPEQELQQQCEEMMK